MTTRYNVDGRRRSLSKLLATALGLGTLGSFLGLPEARAEDPQKLDPKDSTASALGYVEDASTVDTAKFPKRAGAEGATQFCKNCQFYSGSASGYGPCAIFGGKAVAANGWCNSWVKKSG
jgi:hypothetical protein